MSIHTLPVSRRTTALFVSACMAGATSAGTLALSGPAAGAESQSVQLLEAKLRPSGDPDGSGEATFRLRKAKGKICASVTWRNIDTPDAAHIHRKSDGTVLVDLSGSVTGGAHCATGVSHKLIGRILDHPRRYYFNVHNATYPAGAIQGTLHH
jgi:CHRD domain-containing protein